MSRYRKPNSIKASRLTLYLTNMELAKNMAGELSCSWFIDELIAREHRRRERKVTQLAENSALTAQNSVLRCN